jgi:Domain of unknown function (DUF4192)
VTTPACLLSVIPHLLGFQPVNSLIIIGTEPPSHKAKVTLRYELPDPPDLRAADEIIRHATGILATQTAWRDLGWRYMTAASRSPLSLQTDWVAARLHGQPAA